MKLPNDLIKATDYSKAKDREIHEFEYRNGKYIHKYVLGGEHELTSQEVVDCLNAISTIDCDLQTAYAFIQGQKDKIADLKAKLAESEKDRLMWQEMYKSADKQNKDICETDIYPLQEENLKLKQQLAEKETRIAELEDKDWYEGTIKQLEEQNERLINQLAEKEKELETHKSAIRKMNRNCDTVKCQNKISFAVEQLEKARSNILCNEKFYFENLNKYIDEQIDNQIKAIKGE